MRCGGSGDGSTSERRGRDWLIEVTLWGDGKNGDARNVNAVKYRSVKTARKGLRGEGEREKGGMRFAKFAGGRRREGEMAKRLDKGDSGYSSQIYYVIVISR